VINPLALPLGIVVRLVGGVRQMQQDLHRLANAADDLPRIEAELTRMIEEAEGTMERGVRGVEALVAALPDIALGIAELSRAADAAEKMVGGIDEVREAREVLLSSRATLERASATIEEALLRIEPLQGLTERIGRLSDRLPGGHRERQ
jgi:methyl-accepting chemotaxis protein